MFGLFTSKAPTNLSQKPVFPLAEHSLTLFKHNQDKTPYDLQNFNHGLLLNDCTVLFNAKLDALKAADYRMAIGFSVGVAAFVLSFVFPVSMVMVAGFAYGAYYLALRQQLYTEYTQSLENMMNALKWSTGDVKNNRGVLSSEVILNLVKALVPVATKQQLFDVIDDKVEKQLIDTAEHTAQEVKFGDVKLDEEQKKLYYTLYGFEQGNALDVAKGLGHAIVNGFNYAKNALFAQTSTQENKPSALRV